ncbi:hypothetical protein H7T43_04255 [Peribacillus simplex]|uniref:hypothetical protein n=1 Tax=Peribacillus simplex TaxID=1478 RepID=UPI00298A005A|nr:hypothetical protein [Peribacillus simplex]MBX9954125.1 hypothetical protein [Peribacillus simplex]
MIKHDSISVLVIGLISIAFVLADWRIGFLTFADILISLAAIIIVIKGLINKSLYFKYNQLYLIVGFILVVSINIFSNLLFNADFLEDLGIKGFFKISCFIIMFTLVFNFIKELALEVKLLQVLNITAFIVCILGIYISISIYLNGIFPYEFLWKFTRDDLASYAYKGWDESVIRTRSIFSEPAHLGFYLNAILAITYLNKYKYNINKFIDFTIIITIILTFSYSSIIIMLLIKIFNYAKIDKLKHFYVSKKSIVITIIVAISIISMWNQIEKTLINRTQEILSGADTSASARVEGSWSFVNKEHIFIGNGIGNTPPIFNNYAYVLSDLGLIGFILFVIFSFIVLKKNFQLGLVFIAMNFQKGGYLGAGYWIFILLVLIYINRKNRNPVG